MTITEPRTTPTATPTPTGAPSPTGTHTPTGAAGAGPRGRWPSAADALAVTLAARAAEHDRAGDFPHEAFDALREQGFVSMLVPAELGGGDAPFADACAALAALARGCPSSALALSMHSHLVAAQVWRHRRGLPAPVLTRVAADRVVLVSTGAADWLASSGTARRVEGGYRIDASKQPASGAPAGAVVVTSVRWDDAPDGPQVLHAAIPMAADGVRVVETWDAMGMRATGSHTVVFEDVFVPDAAVSLVRPADVWHPVWSTVVGCALPLIMAVYLGVAEEVAARALALAVPRADHPDVAPLVGRMGNRLTVLRDTVAAMVAAADDLRFDNTIELAATMLSRKSIAADAALDVGRLALEVGGGAAFASANGVERLYRDLHGASYHPLPTARQERVTGRLALGLDPFG